MPICSQCGQPATLHLHTKDYNLQVSDVIFDYYRCQNPECGLVFLFPVLENLRDYYPDNYMNYTRPQSLADLEKLFEYQEEIKIREVQQYAASGGKLLEIGPSYGGFAYRAKKAGFEVEAVEMNEEACRFMNEVIGIKAHATDDPIAYLRTSTEYDVIALWHVIEHVPDPWTMLEVIPQHLKPGGIVVIAAPNPQAFQFKFFRSLWWPLEAPRHLNLIPAHVIMQRFSKHNLVPLVYDSNDELSKRIDYTYWHYGFTRHFSNPLLKRLARIISGLTHSFFSPFERQQFGGSTYTLIFQKPSAE